MDTKNSFCSSLKGRPGKLFLGLTGPLAGGKTAVARRFAELGALVLSADELAAAQLRPGAQAYRAVVSRYGEKALLPDGTVNRKFLAHKVFADKGARSWLESFIHPAVLAGIWEQARKAKNPLVVAEIPLLFETGSQASFDFVLCVSAPKAARLARARTRGWTAAEFQRREAAQLCPARKCALSDIVIANNGTRAALHKRADALFATLAALNAAPAKHDCRPAQNRAVACKKRKEQRKK